MRFATFLWLSPHFHDYQIKLEMPLPPAAGMTRAGHLRREHSNPSRDDHPLSRCLSLDSNNSHCLLSIRHISLHRMAIAPEFPELSQNLVLVVPVFLPLGGGVQMRAAPRWDPQRPRGRVIPLYDLASCFALPCWKVTLRVWIAHQQCVALPAVWHEFPKSNKDHCDTKQFLFCVGAGAREVKASFSAYEYLWRCKN